MIDDIQQKLQEFTSSQLQNEIDRREQESKEALKDRSNRLFYRKVDKTFATVQEKVAFINSLTPEQQKNLKEVTPSQYSYGSRKPALYLLDRETDEEVAARLSRTGHAYENYDQCTAAFYENGKKLGTANYEMLSEAEAAVENWENDFYDDNHYGPYTDEEPDRYGYGNSSWHCSREECWGPER